MIFIVFDTRSSSTPTPSRTGTRHLRAGDDHGLHLRRLRVVRVPDQQWCTEFPTACRRPIGGRVADRTASSTIRRVGLRPSAPDRFREAHEDPGLGDTDAIADTAWRGWITTSSPATSRTWSAGHGRAASASHIGPACCAIEMMATGAYTTRWPGGMETFRARPPGRPHDRGRVSFQKMARIAPGLRPDDGAEGSSRCLRAERRHVQQLRHRAGVDRVVPVDVYALAVCPGRRPCCTPSSPCTKRSRPVNSPAPEAKWAAPASPSSSATADRVRRRGRP